MLLILVILTRIKKTKINKEKLFIFIFLSIKNNKMKFYYILLSNLYQNKICIEKYEINKN